jgi:cation:H+ antiporter
MEAIEHYIQTDLIAAWVAIAVSFVVLFKCADIFVDSSVVLANRFRIPKLVIGIVLVSLATTAPELSVSLTAALRGSPEIALGNAIGSVICDDGLALALAGIVSISPVAIIPSVLRSSGIFLIAVEIITFLFVIFDYTLNRWEGMVLVVLFAGYMVFLFRQSKRGDLEAEKMPNRIKEGKDASVVKLFAFFILALAGIIIASKFIVTSATTIASAFHISETIIAMTLVAFGTSVPEVATCITAARKGEGAIAVGNILGADIMNICWVAGASAIANNLTLGTKEIYFMFPSMFIIVGAMLCMLRMGYSLTRTKGLILFGLYVLYLVICFIFFLPQVS